MSISKTGGVLKKIISICGAALVWMGLAAEPAPAAQQTATTTVEQAASASPRNRRLNLARSLETSSPAPATGDTLAAEPTGDVATSAPLPSVPGIAAECVGPAATDGAPATAEFLLVTRKLADDAPMSLGPDHARDAVDTELDAAFISLSSATPDLGIFGALTVRDPGRQRLLCALHDVIYPGSSDAWSTLRARGAGGRAEAAAARVERRLAVMEATFWTELDHAERVILRASALKAGGLLRISQARIGRHLGESLGQYLAEYPDGWSQSYTSRLKWRAIGRMQASLPDTPRA